MTILSIWTTLETVRETVLSGKIEALSSTAAVLAAILAAATLLKLSKDYIQGQPLDIWDLLRPIILLTLVCLFRPMVLDPLDSIVNVFTRDAADAVSVSTGEAGGQQGDYQRDGNNSLLHEILLPFANLNNRIRDWLQRENRF